MIRGDLALTETLQVDPHNSIYFVFLHSETKSA